MAAAVVAAAPLAFAAHPSLTEDTGTQGKDRFELELGLQQTHDGDARSFEFGPQLSYGVAANLDLILRPTWLDNRFTGAERNQRERGVGDTALDFKWRLHEVDAMSFGVRAGVDLPTGSDTRGLGQGRPRITACSSQASTPRPGRSQPQCRLRVQPTDPRPTP